MAHDVNQRETDVAAQVRSALIERISSERYDLWIPETTQWCWENSSLQIAFQSDFTCQLAKRMVAEEIANSVTEVVGYAAEVNYVVSAESATQERLEVANDLDTQSLKARAGKRYSSAEGEITEARTSRESSATDRGRAGLAPSSAVGAGSAPRPTTCTTRTMELWEHYVRGPSNQLAWTTANLVVSEPGKLSPVLLHGPNGCGKSLLAAAVAEQLRTVRRMRRVVHMSSEQFTNDFMEGLRGGGLPMFRRKYRDVEAFILDDIQFFVGKKSTIGELKHTLDNLMRLGKQVVLTADRTLNELQALGGDLIGRLRSGMVTPLFPLDESTRAAILERHFMASGIKVQASVVSAIAARAIGDGRVLSGIAKRMTAVSALHPEDLSWEKCWEAIADLVQSTQPVVRIADIERAVCGMFGLEPDSLQSAAKTRSVSQPRMLAMFLSRKYTPAAYKEIGDYFGKRRHSTVISAEKTVEGWLAENSDMRLARGLSVRDALRQVEAQLHVG